MAFVCGCLGPVEEEFHMDEGTGHQTEACRGRGCPVLPRGLLLLQLDWDLPVFPVCRADVMIHSSS